MSENNLEAAVELLEPVAELPNSILDTASNRVNYFAEVAKSFTTKRGVQLRSAVKKRGWLPETIVNITRLNNNTFVLSPNPTNDQFDITLPQGNYTLQVFDALGKQIFSKSTEGSSKVDVHAWQNGMYTVSLLNKATNKKTFSKIVVQH